MLTFLGILILSYGCSSSESNAIQKEKRPSYFIAFDMADGDRVIEKSTNSSYTSSGKISSFSIYKGSIKFHVVHNGVSPEKYLNNSIPFNIEYKNWSTRFTSKCRCEINSVEPVKSAKKRNIQPYRLKGSFKSCILGKEDMTTKTSISNGEFDILVYYSKD